MLMISVMAAVATVAPGGAKTMGMDDWHAMTVLEVGADAGTGGPRYVRVAAGDLDGDGLADDAILKLRCDGDGKLGDAHYILSPRDAASGQATGRRMHKPVTFVKEWGAAPPQMLALKPSYDVKTMKGARVAAGAEGWTPITLGNADGLCAARAVTTRSNIQNN